MANNRLGTLRNSSDFEDLKITGKKVSSKGWLLFVYKPNSLKSFRIGFTISRKVGSAVIRNKLRRWAKEFFREKLKEKDYFIDGNLILRPQKDDFYKAITHEEFNNALDLIWRNLK